MVEINCGRVVYYQRGQGAISIWRCPLTSIGIPMLKIRWSRDHLIFNMGIPIHGQDGIYIETGPLFQYEYCLPDYRDSHYEVISMKEILTQMRWHLYITILGLHPANWRRHYFVTTLAGHKPRISSVYNDRAHGYVLHVWTQFWYIYRCCQQHNRMPLQTAWYQLGPSSKSMKVHYLKSTGWLPCQPVGMDDKRW